MAMAAVIAFEASRQAVATSHARQEWHASLDAWVESVEAHLPEDIPSLEELTHAVLARRQALTGQITEALVAQRHGPLLHQRTLPCPHGQHRLLARPAPPRTVHPMVGDVSLSRPSCSCTDGQPRCSPRDDALPLSERRTPWDLPQAAARLAAAGPVQTAQERFTPLTGLSLRDQTSHTGAGALSQELGGLDVSPPATEIARRVAEMAAGQTGRPVLVLAIDGACVPTRPEDAKRPAAGRQPTRAKRAPWPGAWKAATGVRCSLVDRERIVHRLSGSQVGGDDEVGAALRQVQAAGLIPEDQGRVCVLGDGAQWIWHQVNTLFPRAMPSLDDDHGRAPVHTVGALPCTEATGQAREWGEALMARLCWGSVAWAIEGWEALPPRHAQSAAEIRTLSGLLRHSAEWLPDRSTRTGGYPIGRGGLEAATTRLRQVRLKRSGAWWSLEQANHRLAWRGAIDNGTFERVFEADKRRALQRHGGNPPSELRHAPKLIYRQSHPTPLPTRNGQSSA